MPPLDVKVNKDKAFRTVPRDQYMRFPMLKNSTQISQNFCVTAKL